MRLYEAPWGLEVVSAKALKGFGGRGMLEPAEDHDGNIWGVVHTVRSAGAIYVLHVFRMKAKRRAALRYVGRWNGSRVFTRETRRSWALRTR
jgi:phage-related protein